MGILADAVNGRGRAGVAFGKLERKADGQRGGRATFMADHSRRGTRGQLVGGREKGQVADFKTSENVSSLSAFRRICQPKSTLVDLQGVDHLVGRT